MLIRSAHSGGAPRSGTQARRASRTRRSCALAAALVLATLLAGCVPAEVPRLDTQVPATWQHAPPEAAAQTAAPDLSGWWKAFHDPELDRLVDRALNDNLTIAQAALRMDAARGLARHKYSAFLPSLGAHTFAEPAPDSSASYFQMGFDAKWELGIFGSAKSHARTVIADRRIAESDAQAARVSVVAEVARTYVELRAAQQRLELLDKLAALADDKVALTNTRVRLRMASAADVARVEVERASAQAALYEPRLAVERSRQQIAVLLGQTQAAPDLIAPGQPPDLGELRIASAPADLLRTRPEIRRAEAEVLKAAGELGLARAEMYPRLGLGGSLTYAAKVIGHTRLSDTDDIVTFGPIIDIPLFDWGARRAAADARDAQLSASVLAYRQAVLEGVSEAETALAALEQQRERSLALGRGLAGLEHSDVATGKLSTLGLADGFDRTASRAALVQAQLDAAQAQQDRSVAFIALYKALGGAPMPQAKK